MNEDLREFRHLYSLSARLAEELSKEQVLECARLLALHLADYRERFGVTPPANLLELLGVVEITDEQARLLRDGMEILTGYLGNLAEGLDEDEPRH